MKKRTYALIQGIVGGVATIAQAVVVFAAPPYAVAIVASIGIAATAINEICGLFVKNDLDKISV
jgi:hypothetical protein